MASIVLPESDSGTCMLPSDDSDTDSVGDAIILPCDDDNVVAMLQQPMRKNTKPKKGDQKRKKRKNVVHDGPDLATFLAQTNYVVDVPAVLPHMVMETPMNFWELYSPPRVAVQLNKMGISGCRSIDLKTNWNLNNDDHEMNMLVDLQAHCPKFLIVSAPCTMFSKLMQTNWMRMMRDKREAAAKEGVRHLSIGCAAVQIQLDRHDIECKKAGWYAMEHPHGASSWCKPCVDDLDGDTVTFDQCMLGLSTPRSNQLLRKRTTIKTNSRRILANFSGLKCDGCHKHRPGGISGSEDGIKISTHSQQYPQKMVQLLAKSVIEELQTL